MFDTIKNNPLTSLFGLFATVVVVLIVLESLEVTNFIDSMEMDLMSKSNTDDDEKILSDMMNYQKAECSDDLMPKNNIQDPEWAKDFHKQDNMLLQRNYIDATTQPENFQITRSVCGRRYMSRDIRRVPTVTRDPATINSFNLPVIDPVCAKEYNDMKGNLDYGCDTQEWVDDKNTLKALGYPLPKNPKYKSV